MRFVSPWHVIKERLFWSTENMSCQYLNYIGGQWVPSRTQQTFPNINPADTDDIVGSFPASGPDDVAAAFEAAEKAQPAWGALPAPRRGEYLFKAAEILESQLTSAATDMTREEGKTLPEATGEVKRSVQTFRLSAEEARRLGGDIIPLEGAPQQGGRFGFTLRVPLGVVCAITPFSRLKVA